MGSESRSLNLMNAEHIALLAYMQRYIQSITKEGRKPGEVITIGKNDQNQQQRTT